MPVELEPRRRSDPDVPSKRSAGLPIILGPLPSHWVVPRSARKCTCVSISGIPSTVNGHSICALVRGKRRSMQYPIPLMANKVRGLGGGMEENTKEHPEPLKLAPKCHNSLVSWMARVEDVINELWNVATGEAWDSVSVSGGVYCLYVSPALYSLPTTRRRNHPHNPVARSSLAITTN